MAKRIYSPFLIVFLLILLFAFDKTPDYFIHQNLEFKCSS